MRIRLVGSGPGSARVTGAGFGVPPKRTSLSRHPSKGSAHLLVPIKGKSAMARARALPAVARIVVLFIVSLLATSCRKGMVDQQHLKPLAEDTFFSDDRGSRVPPAHTVARNQLREDEQFFTGKIGNDLAATFPIPITRELLARGRERFDIDCALCHGRTGDGNGMIVQRGFPQPPSFHEQRLRDAPSGHFFDVITNGYGVMYSYASRVSPEDRWAITAYIRALQLSEHASPRDADAEALKKLEAAR